MPGGALKVGVTALGASVGVPRCPLDFLPLTVARAGRCVSGAAASSAA
jgi:hypothetical protein